jgi:hypothetical protein
MEFTQQEAFMHSSIRILIGFLVVLTLPACTGGRQKPPQCSGKYEQVNAPRHYLHPEAKP